MKDSDNQEKGLAANDSVPMVQESATHKHLEDKGAFWLVSTALAIQVFMVTLEIPVVTTALVAITEELGGFDQLSWVIASYLLGYAAVLVVFAKFSDIFGRKPVFSLSIVIFLIFSAACSAAQTMTQLIVFRAFQGIGGGGGYAMSQVIITDLVPPERYSKYVSQLAIVSSLALLLGPIVGGAISSNITWRWIFIINVPTSFVALGFTAFGMPKNFGLKGQSSSQVQAQEKSAAKSMLARIDYFGTILLLLAVLSLTAGFENAGSEFPWKSAFVIALLLVSACFWTALLLWERYLTLKESGREPVLPWRFFTNRIMIGVLIGLLFLGGPFVVTIFQLPGRFQLVHRLSALDAGVRLIPFSLATPVGTAIASGIAGRLKVPAIYFILAGASFQVVGFALLGTLPASLDIPSRIYGFEFLAGFGCGMSLTPLLLLIPVTVQARDTAVGMGAGNQFRMIGSSIIIAISTSTFNSYLRPKLVGLVGSSDLDTLVTLGEQLAMLPPELQGQVRLTLARAYNRQMLVLCASAAAQIPAGLLLWKKEQLLI